MKINNIILLGFLVIICFGFIVKKKLFIGKYTGYTLGYEGEVIDNKFIKKRTKTPSKLTINSDGSFELIHPDLSREFRPNKTEDFFCIGKYEVHGDTLILNSQYQHNNYISVHESKKDFCNNDVLGIEIKYSEYDHNPTYIIDGIKYESKRKVDTTYQTFQKITIEYVDTVFENDNDHYSISDSKPSFYRNTRPLLLKFSRFHPSIRKWVYTIKDSTMNYFQCVLTPDINGQSLVLENEKFLIMDTMLIHLNDSFLEIDTFKKSK